MEGLNSGRGHNFRETGRTFEFQMLGQIDVDDKRYKELLARLSGSSQPGYLGRSQSIELAKECQPGDPENPNKSFLNDLLIEVQDQFEVAGIEATVRAYTAVGTPLDHLHGVDAFITVTVDGREFVCTLDITLNPDKQASGHKADLIVGEVADPNVNNLQQNKYLEQVEEIGRKIVTMLLKKVTTKQSQAELRERLYGLNQPEAGVDL